MERISRRAFTSKFPAIANCIESDVKISAAHPNNSETPEPQIIKCKAIWDTGATGSVISKNLASELGLKYIDEVEVITANGKRTAKVYLVNISLPNKVRFLGVPVTDGDILGVPFLIGMDIIGKGDFAVTHSDGNTCLSFQIPSSTKIDFTKDIEAINKKTQRRLNRKKRGHFPWDKK